MHGLRRRLSEPRMAGHLPADRSANQRVTSAGDSFLCILMCGTQHTYVQSKKQAKIAPVENSKRAGSTGLSWDLRQKLVYQAKAVVGGTPTPGNEKRVTAGIQVENRIRAAEARAIRVPEIALIISVPVGPIRLQFSVPSL